MERVRDGHVTNLGAASGIVAGLVAITPGAGFVSGMPPILIGLIAGVICSYAVNLKTRAGFDDALDVVGVHLVGGLVGSLLIGLLANPAYFGEAVSSVSGFEAGLFEGGDLGLLGEQVLANGATIVYSFLVTFALAKVLDATIGLRVDEETETLGLDQAEHAETAYHTTSEPAEAQRSRTGSPSHTNPRRVDETDHRSDQAVQAR